ncbi:MAG: TssQ family T6SS-associated lipoprotein [Casimicrobiaceae bacterium]
MSTPALRRFPSVLGAAIAASLAVVACAPPPQPTVNYPAAAAQPTRSEPQTAEPPPAEPSPPPPPAAVAPAPVVPPSPPEPSAAEVSLNSGVAAYERGEFAQAIRILTPLSTDTSLSVEQRLRALKTLAFAQCVTGATSACRNSFERAFRLDATFDLARTEHGHPIWGPQFARARRAVLGR